MGNELLHNGHPILSWNADNMVVKIDAAENVKPAKDKARERMDGMIGLIEALGRAILGGGQMKSAYDDLTSEQIKERMTP